ncbi:MAG: hypothetical protein ACK41D_02560 [Rubricoccaceae bacterium]
MYEPLDTGDDLHVAEDLRYERAARGVERAARLGLGLVVLLAVAGFFGSGPLSAASSPSGPARVHYERFARLDTPIVVRIVLETAPRDTVVAWLPVDYSGAMRLVATVPEPASVRAAGAYVRYAFLALPGEPFAARFEVRPRVVGRVTGSVRVEDGPEARLRQFIYP